MNEPKHYHDPGAHVHAVEACLVVGAFMLGVVLVGPWLLGACFHYIMWVLRVLGIEL